MAGLWAIRRAHAIAEATAAQPRISGDLVASRPSADGLVQVAAELIRRATGTEYVVITDTRGVRRWHTHTGRIGRVVSTDPSDVLAHREVSSCPTH
ncbi:hypothetical protein [Streptomyces sp. NPDC050485]|uniref:hypothetical protein n=1 Tax=Streptomyces sp. NPDC050485 TaxID=3365617 RepID=UPI0037A1FC1A